MPHMPRASLSCALFYGLLACAAQPQPALPRDEAPARDLIVRTEHFELHANAWVDLHAWLVHRARTEGARDLESAPFEREIREYAAALRGAKDERAADEDALTRLRRCHDDRCATDALAPTPFGPPFARALPTYVQIAWNRRSAAARGAIERAAPLLRFESDLTDGLAKDLGLPEEPERVRLDVVAHDAGGRAGPGLLAAAGPCFVGDAILECAFFAWARANAPKLELARAIKKGVSAERARRLWDAVVAYAIVVRVQERTNHRSWLAKKLTESEPELAKWLAREWPKRRAGEAAQSFAERLQAEVGDQ
jgi:hypothetical protein